MEQDDTSLPKRGLLCSQFKFFFLQGKQSAKTECVQLGCQGAKEAPLLTQQGHTQNSKKNGDYILLWLCLLSACSVLMNLADCYHSNVTLYSPSAFVVTKTSGISRLIFYLLYSDSEGQKFPALMIFHMNTTEKKKTCLNLISSTKDIETGICLDSPSSPKPRTWQRVR